MAKIVALYKKPANPAAFDAYYFSTHVPIAKQISGLRRYEVNVGPVTTLQGASPYHMAAVLSFDSMSAIQQALNSPEGAATATAADLANFAQAGVDVLLFDTREI